MIKEIKENLLLSADFKKDKFREQIPFLIGSLPVVIEWSDGKLETCLIYDDVEISFFPELKELMGEKAERSMFENLLKSKWIEELIIKLEKDLKRLKRKKILNKKKFKEIKIINIEEWKKIKK